MRNRLVQGFVVFALVAVLCGVVTTGAAGPVVSGGGIANVMDVDGLVFAGAGEFAVNGGLTPAGKAHGRITFVFRGEFANSWGAVPGVTDLFRLSGKVTSVSANGETVVLGGVLTEIDYDASGGVVFVEEDVPFEITVQSGSSTFILQFCELPPFTIDVAKGTVGLYGGQPGVLD